MSHRRSTRPSRTCGWIALLALATACESVAPGSPDASDIPASELRERHATVALGQTPAEVAGTMGSLSVRRPGHPDAPYPTPLHVEEWTGPAGEAVRLEIYVVATRPPEECPDLLYDDAPIAFVGGRVVATTWEEVEWRWREWGGELARLRALQDRVGECPEPTEPPLDSPTEPLSEPLSSPTPD